MIGTEFELKMTKLYEELKLLQKDTFAQEHDEVIHELDKAMGAVDHAIDVVQKAKDGRSTSFFVDMEDIPDSMLLPSETQIAYYEDQKNDIYLSLKVRGEVSVTYKEENYHDVLEFPKELINIIKNGYYDEDGMHHSYLDHMDINVSMNNWFEVFTMDKDGNADPAKSFLVDAENCTQADIESIFTDLAGDILKEREAAQKEAENFELE